AEAETTPFAYSATGGDGPTMRLNELFDHRQPDACPARRPRPRGIHSIEPLEHVRHVLRGNTAAGVLHLNPDAIHLRERAHLDRTAWRCVLQRVDQQIAKHLPNTLWVRIDDGIFGADAKFDAL